MATLGEQAVGSIVKLNVGGVATDFIVVHQGLPSTDYDVSCDGVWMLMKSGYANVTYGSDNQYENSNLHSYANTTFLELLDDSVKNAIKEVKIPYRKGANPSETVAKGENGLTAKIFSLSCAEIDDVPTYAAVEGTALSYFSGGGQDKRICYSSSGSAQTYWTRSPNTNGTSNVNRAYRVNTYGNSSGRSVSSATDKIRPSFIFPYEINVDDAGFVDGTAASSGGISGSVLINGVMRELTGEGYVNINGVLCPISDSGVNIGGIINSTKG